jgi:acetyl esterase
MHRLQPAMRAVLARNAGLRGTGPDRYAIPLPEARAQLEREREPWLIDGPACECTPLELALERAGHAHKAWGLRVLPADRHDDRLLIYLHGGGWCVGSSRTHDNIVRRLASALQGEAWSIDYALAPEHPHPAGLIEVLTVVRAAARTHPDRALILAGDSAGANLALATALLLRDAGEPILDSLMLFYGVYDEGFDDPGMAEFGDGRFGLSVTAQRRYLEAYLPREAPIDAFRKASFPLTWHAPLGGLPPIWMALAELDILADQNRRLAAGLRAAGTAITVEEVRGVTHGFLSYGQLLPAAAETLERAAQHWRSRHGSP